MIHREKGKWKKEEPAPKRQNACNWLGMCPDVGSCIRCPVNNVKNKTEKETINILNKWEAQQK
jgi:hypothetical protein